MFDSKFTPIFRYFSVGSCNRRINSDYNFDNKERDNNNNNNIDDDGNEGDNN